MEECTPRSAHTMSGGPSAQRQLGLGELGTGVSHSQRVFVALGSRAGTGSLLQGVRGLSPHPRKKDLYRTSSYQGMLPLRESITV